MSNVTYLLQLQVTEVGHNLQGLPTYVNCKTSKRAPYKKTKNLAGFLSGEIQRSFGNEPGDLKLKGWFMRNEFFNPRSEPNK